MHKLLPFLLILFAVGCERPSSASPMNHAHVEQKMDHVDLEPLPDHVWRGVCYAHSWELMGVHGYGTDASLEALQHMKSHGVDYISITPFGFMQSLNSTDIRGSHNMLAKFGETDERIEEVTAQAKGLGIKIMLKPHIWIKGGQWRGVIKPLDSDGKVVWDTWWKNHSAWILHYAELAQKLKIESLVIGLELHTAVQNKPEALIALANDVRKVYDGHITYSANWNEPVPQKVWESMDSVGVQFYPPLVEKGEAQTDAIMRKNLNKHLDHWVDMANRSKKPLVITEYGFRSAKGAAKFPNAWPDRNPNETPDNELQATLYKIFFEEFGKRDEVLGVFLWKYFTNKDTDEEGPNGFSPRGKPAEAVIKTAHSRGSEG